MVRLEDVTRCRNAGEPVPQERFSVYRVKTKQQFAEEFWACASRIDAERLCQVLLLEDPNVDLQNPFDEVYVFDNILGKKVFERNANLFPPSSPGHATK